MPYDQLIDDENVDMDEEEDNDDMDDWTTVQMNVDINDWKENHMNLDWVYTKVINDWINTLIRPTYSLLIPAMIINSLAIYKITGSKYKIILLLFSFLFSNIPQKFEDFITYMVHVFAIYCTYSYEQNIYVLWTILTMSALITYFNLTTGVITFIVCYTNYRMNIHSHIIIDIILIFILIFAMILNRFNEHNNNDISLQPKLVRILNFIRPLVGVLIFTFFGNKDHPEKYWPFIIGIGAAYILQLIQDTTNDSSCRQLCTWLFLLNFHKLTCFLLVLFNSIVFTYMSNYFKLLWLDSGIPRKTEIQSMVFIIFIGCIPIYFHGRNYMSTRPHTDTFRNTLRRQHYFF